MIFSFLLTSAILFVLGAAVGSFLNVIIYRTVTEESWVMGRSKCEQCSKKISWYDNIPLFSYILLGGKCRNCQRAISLSHPVIEFLTGALFVWWYWGGSLFFRLTQAPFQTLQPMFWLGVGMLLLIIFFADLIYFLIPDVAVALLLIMTISYRVALVLHGVMQLEDLLKASMGLVLAVTLLGSLWLVTKGRGMGLGDVKLAAPMALLLGWPDIVVGMFLAFVLGAIVGVVLILTGRRKMKHIIPFGPFMVMATVITLIWGTEIYTWYMGLL